MSSNWDENLSSEDRRNAYIEGKIWALDHLLGSALRAAGVRKPEELDEIFEQALKCYPGAQDPEGPIGQGVREIFDHARGHLGER